MIIIWIHFIGIMSDVQAHIPDVSSARSVDEDDIGKLLLNMQKQGYNRRTRPNFNRLHLPMYNHVVIKHSEKPTEVDISIQVGSLRSLSEQTMDYKLELYFREFWEEDRLMFDPQEYSNHTTLILHESLVDSLWLPDTFLPDAYASTNPDAKHNSITHRSLLRLNSTGRVLYSQKLSITAECPMDLSFYPFDEQRCKLSIESYGYDTDSLIYFWDRDDNEPVQVRPDLELPDFKLIRVLRKRRNITTSTGTYSRLECCFVFTRNAGYYFVQLFIPATVIIIIAWLSLCLEKESNLSDMIQIIIATTFFYFSYNAVMPKVSYIKAMDIFMGFCFLFVFLGLVKLAIVKYLHNRIEPSSENYSINGASTEMVSMLSTEQHKSPKSAQYSASPRIRKQFYTYLYFHRASVAVYSLIFFLFFLVYFITYMVVLTHKSRDPVCAD